jgi:hypothetical protein
MFRLQQDEQSHPAYPVINGQAMQIEPTAVKILGCQRSVPVDHRPT